VKDINIQNTVLTFDLSEDEDLPGLSLKRALDENIWIIGPTSWAEEEEEEEEEEDIFYTPKVI